MKITIKNLQKKIPIYPRRIKRAILNVLSGEAVKESGEITICFVGDYKIRKLNREFLKKDMPTDVLAFKITENKDKNEMVSDIIVSSDTALRNSKTYKTTPAFEANLYVIHGLLHLLGYNDHSLKARRLMRKKENEYAY